MFENILNSFISKVPFFVLVSMLLSYLIWSKYRNNKKLTPKDVDGVISFLGVFCLILPVFFSFCFIIFFLFSSFAGVSLSLSNLFNYSNYISSFLASLLLISFLINYDHKEDTEEIFQQVMNRFILFYLFFIIFLILMLISFLVKDFNYFLPLIILSLIVMVTLLIIIYWIIKNLFEFKLNLIEFNKKDRISSILTLVFFVVVSILIFNNFVPDINYSEPKDLGFVIYGDSAKDLEYFNRWSISVNLSFNKYLKELITQIPVYYGRYDLDTNGYAGDNFNIYLSGSENNNQKKIISGWDSFSEINDSLIEEVTKKDDFLILRYGPDFSYYSKLLLEGYSSVNLSDYYNYEVVSYSSQYCFEGSCYIFLDFNYSMNKKLTHYVEERINLAYHDVINISNCKLTSLWLHNDGVKFFANDNKCSNGFCDLEIVNSEDGQEIGRIVLFLEEGIFEVRLVELYDTINLRLEVPISCY